MRPSSPKALRCAIYTRKSTEHNLDLTFNSLDAQREACEAYIKSQAHEGWHLVPDRFDDGAFSGASLERPALQALLDLVRARKIEVIVVYKVDRLTRSLADFAKLVELFDTNNASFVSVTQNFNTTSSMGRLTLNVLLSFAQFEREVIGERVRDKIAASKRKGLWVGGPIPLGYASVEKKLVIVPAEADTVRLIFDLYLKLESIARVAAELDRLGIKTKRQVLSNGRVRGGVRFLIGPLGYLLKNRFYIGEVVYRGEICVGEHQPIVDRALFQAVQVKRKERMIARQLFRSRSPAILTGKLFDDQDNRMSPSHSNKRGIRYRYYVSQALLQGRAAQAGSVSRVSAPEIEQVVLNSLREHLAEIECANNEPAIGNRQLIEGYVERIVLKPLSIELIMRNNKLDRTEQKEEGDFLERSLGESLTLDLPWRAPTSKAMKGILHEPEASREMTPASRDALLTAIAKARGWIDDLLSARAASFAEIAKREGKVERHIRFLAPLAFVSPTFVMAIAFGRGDQGLTVSAVAKTVPLLWSAREELAWVVPPTDVGGTP